MASKKPDLVGTHEILERHGIKRHRVFRFLRRGLWPEPVATLKVGAVFDAQAVDRAVAKLKRDGQL